MIIFMLLHNIGHFPPQFDITNILGRAAWHGVFKRNKAVKITADFQVSTTILYFVRVMKKSNLF